MGGAGGVAGPLDTATFNGCKLCRWGRQALAWPVK